MAEFVVAGVVDDPGYKGLPVPDIHVANESQIAIAGIRDGMAPGPDGKKRASLALAFTLPDGKVVLVETSWRLFAFAYKYFEERFGPADNVGMQLEVDLSSGQGARSRLEVIEDISQAFYECELCGKRVEAKNFEGDTDEEKQLAMLQWVYRHFREEHPDWTPPET